MPIRTTGLTEAIQALDAVSKTQAGYAAKRTMWAFVESAYGGGGFIAEEMQRRFRQPVPRTLTSPIYEKPKVSMVRRGDSVLISSTLRIQDQAGKGNAPSDWLAPVMSWEGGPSMGGRQPVFLTNFQVKMQSILGLPRDQMFVPANSRLGWAKRNATGGYAPSVYSIVGAAFGARRAAGPVRLGSRVANRQGRSSRRSIFYIPPGRGALPAGIYGREAGMLSAIFYQAPQYTVPVLFDYTGIIQRRFDERVVGVFRTELANILG